MSKLFSIIGECCVFRRANRCFALCLLKRGKEEKVEKNKHFKEGVYFKVFTSWPQIKFLLTLNGAAWPQSLTFIKYMMIYDEK